ncbi:MAG: hypothetical protein ONB25_10115 [candidate division KSB1 bacterium]|nr:hypothetical protein [candidate division KSB1 bacterium]
MNTTHYPRFRGLLVVTVLLLAAEVWAQGQRGTQAALDQLDRQLRTAEELLAGNDDPTLRGMLEQAKQMRERAASEMRAGRHGQASTYIAAARRLLDQLTARLLRSPVQQLGERLEDLLRQAEQVVPGSGNSEAERLLAQARRQQRRAIEAQRQQRYQAAAEYYRVAIYLGKRAMELAQGTVRAGSERLEEAREQYQSLLAVAEERVARSDDPVARRSLEQARRHGMLAVRALQRGQTVLAWELYHQSIRLLLRSISLADGETPSMRERAEEEVERVGELMAEVSRQAADSQGPETRLLLQRGADLLARARRNLGAGAFALALQNAELAEGIAFRLMRRSSLQGETLALRAEEEVARLQEDIRQVREMRAGQPGTDELVTQAERLQHLAEMALEQGRYRLALMWVLAGTRLLTPGLNGLQAGTVPTMAAQRIEELDRALEEVQAAGGVSDDRRALIEQARTLRAAAAHALERQQPGVSRSIAETALDLLSKARQPIE